MSMLVRIQRNEQTQALCGKSTDFPSHLKGAWISYQHFKNACTLELGFPLIRLSPILILKGAQRYTISTFSVRS
jgi:hypothetical protein